MSLTLSPIELQEITGYKRPGDQLAELHRRGFARARRSRVTGGIILERAHYDAVCSAGTVLVEHRPKVRPPTLRAVR